MLSALNYVGNIRIILVKNDLNNSLLLFVVNLIISKQNWPYSVIY